MVIARMGVGQEAGGLGRVAGNVLPMLASYNNWLKKFGA